MKVLPLHCQWLDLRVAVSSPGGVDLSCKGFIQKFIDLIWDLNVSVFFTMKEGQVAGSLRYTAVFSVVAQRSTPLVGRSGAWRLRDDTKNGSVAD